jgi:hypothetical protein
MKKYDITETMNELQEDFNNARALIEQWNKNNYSWKKYVKEHAWLRADILKLKKYIKDNKIKSITITTAAIYGIDNKNNVYITGRGNLGIADNFE